jgi:hypothetical protein
MPELQEGRQGALLQGRDHGSWPRQPAGAAIYERDSGIGSLLQLLQDQTQRRLEQLRHEFYLEGRPEDSAGAQHTEDVCREHRPINRSCFLLRRRVVLNGHHSGLAIITVQEIHELRDPTLRYATHSEEQW